jgi:hypothetical protein
MLEDGGWFSWIVLGVGTVVLCSGSVVLVVDSGWGMGGHQQAFFPLVCARFIRDGIPGLENVEDAGGVSRWLVDVGEEIVDVRGVWELAESFGPSRAVAFGRGGGRGVDRATDWGFFF